MQSGMVKNKVSYHHIEGKPKIEVINDINELYHRIFDDADTELLHQRLSEQHDILILTARVDNILVGFKIGYRYNENTFYSWLGGIDLKYRQQGIATQLAKMQEHISKEKGYLKLRTKSMNRFKPMMSLNLKNGFDIVGVYTNEIGQTKIIFEKRIH